MDANKKFWREFFAMYRSLPCIWNLKNPGYSNRGVKNRAYDKLVEKFKEIYPEANKDFVLKKLNIIRTCYRRESRKLEESIKSAATAEEIYVPNLWYFDLLSFLDNEGRGGGGGSGGDEGSSDEKRNDSEKIERLIAAACNGDDDDEEASYSNNQMESVVATIPRKKMKIEELTPFRTHNKNKQQDRKAIPPQQAIHQIQQQQQQRNGRDGQLMKFRQSNNCEQPRQSSSSTPTVSQDLTDNEIATISSSWGLQYRDLDPMQKLFANKSINEVLYQGALGKLHAYSYKAIESQQQLDSSTPAKEEQFERITIDRVNYNDPEYRDQRFHNLNNVIDAINYLKPLEEYIVRENDAAVGILSQLEDTLRSMLEDTDYFDNIR